MSIDLYQCFRPHKLDSNGLLICSNPMKMRGSRAPREHIKVALFLRNNFKMKLTNFYDSLFYILNGQTLT